MRILIDCSGYLFLNAGDIAMLRAAVSRLSELWPDSSIGVISEAPEPLARCCPNTIHVPAVGRREWYRGQFLEGFGPPRFRSHIGGVKRRWRRFAPRTIEFVLQMRARLRGEDFGAVKAFLAWLRDADLVVLSGGGMINDEFGDHALTVLEELEMALRHGTPTVLLGQGIGPLQGGGLRRRAIDVLPNVDLIALREHRSGSPLLQGLGVPAHRIVITGDDAIEQGLSDAADAAAPGEGIGVNVRAAGYSRVGQDVIEELRPVLQSAAARHAAALIPLPISHHPADSDVVALERLVPLESSYPVLPPEDIAGLIRRICDCRVVVTGSYHAGVFALCRGISIVGLARSPYYVDKFMGLADQFGVGVSVARLDRDNAAEEVGALIDAAWETAEELRPLILSAAGRQVEDGRRAYRQVEQIVAQRRHRMGARHQRYLGLRFPARLARGDKR